MSGLAVKPFDLSLNFQNEIALQNVPEIETEIRDSILQTICFRMYHAFTKIKLFFNENEKIALKEHHFFFGDYKINDIELFKYLFDRIDDVDLLDTVFRNYLISNMYKEIEHGLKHSLIIPNKFIPDVRGDSVIQSANFLSA